MTHTPFEELAEQLRPALFAMAYRMLGSVAEAEDVVQEALLRLHRALSDGERIESPRAFATTVATRLAIDELRSARARRETYVGEWLPEPLVVDASGDPARQAEMADSLSLAFSSSWRACRPSSARCCCCATCSTTASTKWR